MSGFTVARLRLLFKFDYKGHSHSCALIHDYSTWGEEPDEDTGMWIVSRAFCSRTRRPQARVINISDILRAVHLIPVYFDQHPIPRSLKHTGCLNYFSTFYVNRFIDPHAFDILS